MLLWESAGRSIVEAKLTADQIQQIFQQIQTSKGNRSLVGKAVDVPKEVYKAYDDLKQKALNSDIVKNFDAIYDQAAEKLKQATGGDQGAMQYVQKYRDFAKRHPIAQGLIYSALIAAAGISGAGAGGAAALGLFKMVDKLLQGEKFSRAAVAGAETGAMAYAAGQIGKAIQGQPAPAGQPQADASVVTTTSSGVHQYGPGGVKAILQQYGPEYSGLLQQYPPGEFAYQQVGRHWSVFDKAGNLVQTFERPSIGGYEESLEISAAAIAKLFEKIERLNNRMLAEGRLVEATAAPQPGFLSRAAGAVGKGLGAVKSGLGKIGRAFTAKVSSDRLMQAWKAAGQPADSADIAAIIRDEGVGEDVIQAVFQNNNIPYSTPSDTATPSVAALTNTILAMNAQQLKGLKQLVDAEILSRSSGTGV
jgi:hypothetical protein